MAIQQQYYTQHYTFPDLVIVCGHPKLGNEMEQLMQLGETTGTYDSFIPASSYYLRDSIIMF